MTKAEKILESKTFLKNEIEKEIPGNKTARVWQKSKEKLDAIFTSYGELPKGLAAHTDSFIFPSAAIYLLLKEEAPDKAFEIMKNSMKEKSMKTGESLAKMTRIPGFKKFFLKMWDSVSRKMFGETAGFKNIFYDCPKGEFRMDITQCPYNKYLTELGCPELTQLFCDNDIYTYGNLPGLSLPELRLSVLAGIAAISRWKLLINKTIGIYFKHKELFLILES